MTKHLILTTSTSVHLERFFIYHFTTLESNSLHL